MTSNAATVAFVVALAIGYYWARLLGAESDLTAARARLSAAARAAWKARRAMLIVIFIAVAAFDTWTRGKGG